MNGFKRFLSQLPAYLLWLLASVVFWSWIVSLRTDTVPEKKVTLFLDVPAVEDAALSAALETALPERLKMVQAHSFSYALFRSDALQKADLYVLPASEMAQFRPELLPLEGFDASETWRDGGKGYGVRCYDAETRTGAAASFISYPAEDHYLCVSAASVHLDDGAALRIARRFLELE